MNTQRRLLRNLPALGRFCSRAVSLERYSQRAPLQDALGGLTAAIVSLPMALAFGTVSGLGAEAGLYGAIIVGLTAAVFGSTRVLISEPTGPMTVMMTAIVAHGVAMDPARGVELAFVVVILAGAFQIVFGKLRLGRYITMMPYGVISGFMSGIGVLLVVQQFPGMLGLTSGQELIHTFRGVTENLTVADHLETAVGIGVFVVLMAYPKALRRYLPPQLLALVLGLIASVLISAGMGPEASAGLQTIGQMDIGLPRPHVPAVPFDVLGTILIDAVLLGLLGSIDTLLTATISDNLSNTHHDSDRELVGQGVGNFLSGLFGGLPGAGATMGTVVTIQTGARSPLAGIVRTLVLIVSVAVFSPVLALIPLAVLSAIAVKVGIDILDWSFLGRAHHISRSTTAIMYLVLGLTVFVDLIVAVGVGVFIANILTIERLSQSTSTRVTSIGVAGDPVQLSPDEREKLAASEGRIVFLELSGPMIFGVAQALARESAAVTPEVEVLVIDLETVPLLDTTISLQLENVITSAHANGTIVVVATQHESVIKKLNRHKLFESAAILKPDRSTALSFACASIEHATEEPATT